MIILYLPQPGLSSAADKVVSSIAERFKVEYATSFDDVVSLLTLQCRNNAYDYKALIVGRDANDMSAEIARIRRTCWDIPIICLTREKKISSIRARVLDAGADDCLPVRHVSVDELKATIRRRVETYSYFTKISTVSIGNVIVNLHSCSVLCDGRVVTFTGAQWSLFRELVRAYPGLASYQRLECSIASYSDSENRNTIAVMISRIREALKSVDAPVIIECRSDHGYLIAPK